MAIFNPLNQETFINPASLVKSQPLQDVREGIFDYGAYPDYNSFTQDALIQHQSCVDTYPTFDKIATSPLPLYAGSYFPVGHYSTALSTAMPVVNQPSISTSVFSDPLDAWLQSQVVGHSNHDAFASVYWSNWSAGSQHSHSHHSCTTQPNVPTRTVRPLKCKAEDSVQSEDGLVSSSWSSYFPSRPDKRIATTRKIVNPPLPDSLQPIRVVSATLPRCPIPGCGVELEAKDSAWRGHFKRAHHNELCLTPGCRTLIPGTCKARCPLPIAGCRSCATDESKPKRLGVRCVGGAMTIDSIGRHLLNVHIKVAFRCPLCGVQNEWRESACARHIRRCAEKHREKINAAILS